MPQVYKDDIKFKTEQIKNAEHKKTKARFLRDTDS